MNKYKMKYIVESKLNNHKIFTEVNSFEGAMNLIELDMTSIGHSFNNDGSAYGSFGLIQIENKILKHDQ
jgi:hypothetical protein